jgi:hypothetical protein
MSSYGDRVYAALGRFQGSLKEFTDLVGQRPADPPRLPRKELDALLALAARARAASDAIAVSLVHITESRVDVVDMQVRLKSETARLASALSGLGDQVDRQHFVREAFSDSLVALDEASHMLASAVFPSAVKGLRAVNVKLWDFQKIQVANYGRILETVVRDRKITQDQQARIEAIGMRIIAAFETINGMLNELAEGRATDGPRLQKRLDQAKASLSKNLGEAAGRMTDALKMFKPVINASQKIAEDVVGLLDDVVIPIFPGHRDLGVLSEAIDEELYESLSGVQAFALLNITARMLGTKVGSRPLLSNDYRIRIDKVFPDRIYFEAERAIIDAVASDDTFAAAPASLHRFKEGSFKQRQFRKGNIQFCFASRAAGRVVVDADLDLYREAIPHLFGEVLVNHLTDSRTDQFIVREILDDQGIEPIGGFTLMNA